MFHTLHPKSLAYFLGRDHGRLPAEAQAKASIQDQRPTEPGLLKDYERGYHHGLIDTGREGNQ